MAASEPRKVTPPRLNPVRVPVPEVPPAERTADFREVLRGYDRSAAVLEAKRCIQCRRPWCVEACPISQDCREYIRLIANDDFPGAARVTIRENPLAQTLCKVCYRYCEDACVVKKKGVPIAIRHLKRAALEIGASDLVYVPSAPKHQRVAVVGAGPAGIMMAWELGVRGYSVTVFEQEPNLGGLMETIPEYRMTEADLATDLARFRGLDVTFVRTTRVGRSPTIASLKAEGYAAIFLALGTPQHRRMGIPGEELEGVIPALEFLRRAHRHEPITLGRRIVVVGGGDVAMDSVRTALRLSRGGHVTLLYRRTRDEMPADPDEIREAEAEGIEFRFLVSPLSIEGAGRVERVRIQSLELGPVDATGRRSPVPIPGAVGTIDCDQVIVAVGQTVDLDGLSPPLDLKVTARGWAEGRGPGFATNIDGVFAAGGRSVVYAMGAAMEAAVEVDAYLARQRGEPPTPQRPDPLGGDQPFRLPAGYTSPIRDP